MRTLGGDDNRRTSAIVQQMAGVGEGGTQGDSTCLTVDNAADGTDTARLVIVLAIAQTEINSWSLGDEFVDGAVLCNEVERLILGDAEIGIHLTVVGHGDQRFADVAADERTHMPGNHRGHAVDRTLHFSIA